MTLNDPDTHLTTGIGCNKKLSPYDTSNTGILFSKGEKIYIGFALTHMSISACRRANNRQYIRVLLFPTNHRLH